MSAPKCPACGTEPDPGARSCWSCGEPLWDSVPTVSQSSTVPDQRKHAVWDNGTVGTPVPGADGLLARLRDGAWLDRQRFPPLRYGVPGLFPEGLTLVPGPPKAGKSWLALDNLLAVACGGRALGQIPCGQPRRVLYLALEDGDRRMQERCRALLAGEPIPPLFSYLTSVDPGRVLAAIGAYLERHPDTAVVWLDTLGKVMPPALFGESAYQRDYRIGSWLKRFADSIPGLPVVVNHHDRKASADDFVDAVSGTHGLAGSADAIAVLRRRRYEAHGSLLVTGRDVPENEYALTFSAGVWQLDGADLGAAASAAAERREAEGLGETSAQIIAFVRRNPPGVSAKQVAEKFGDHARRYLARLAEAGRLEKLGRGYYGVPSVPMSQSQVTGPAEWDTSGTLSQTGDEDSS